MYRKLCPTLFSDDWPAEGPDSIAEVVAEYKLLRKKAPHRHDEKKEYFVGHSGTPSSGDDSNQLEKHYAMALWSLERPWPRRGGGWQRFLDYQTPLRAKQANCGIGEIDLFGVTDRGRFLVVELKYPRNGSPGDSPAHALMQGLRYAALVEANLQPIAIEAEKKLGVKQVDDKTPPIVQVLGPIYWWNHWFKIRDQGGWRPAFTRLALGIEKGTGVTVECLAADDQAELTLGLNGKPPSINPPPAFCAVHLNRNPPEFEPLS